MKSFYLDDKWAHSVNCDKCSSACPVVQNAQSKGIAASFVASHDGEQIDLRMILPDMNYITQLKNICMSCVRENQH